MLEITPSKQNIEKRMEKKLWKQPKTSGTTLNAPTLTLLGEPEGEERKKRPEKIFEKFPNMGKEIVNQAQEVQRVPYRLMQGETHRDTYESS